MRKILALLAASIELVTSKGERVKFYDDLLKDKIVILNMMYAHCDGICPTTTANLKKVRNILRDEINHDIYVYSITVKPEQDSPTDLAEYAKMHEVDYPKCLFLTGEPDELDMLRHAIGFADPNLFSRCANATASMSTARELKSRVLSTV